MELTGDGPGIRTDSANWPINPPIDLYDPQYAALEIDASAFEDAWNRALPDPDDR